MRSMDQVGDACVAPTVSRKRQRLSGHDYTSPGDYFVTICTDQGHSIFGSIVGGEMHLNTAGQTARDCWNAIPEHFPNASIDTFVVMPNHIHGIIRITTGRPHTETVPRSGAAPRSLGAIVGSFKAAVSKRINEARASPGAPIWQRNYFDKRIVEPDGLDRVRAYIRDNPRNWATDPERRRAVSVTRDK
jgi:putative transposase